MRLTAAQIRYLLAIYQLNKKGIVRSSEIADTLNVSRPSVHRMVDQLMKMKLLSKEKYSSICLTENSIDIAEEYEKGFTCISNFLNQNLSLSKDTAEDGSLSILSGMSLTALKDLSIRLNGENLLEGRQEGRQDNA